MEPQPKHTVVCICGHGRSDHFGHGNALNRCEADTCRCNSWFENRPRTLAKEAK